MPYSNRLCTDPVNKKEQGTDNRLEYYGTDSKCIYSTASDGKYNFGSSVRCHKFKCAQDASSVSIILI